MEVIADILLVAGAFGAAIYCLVLARRLRRFNDLEKGVGGAVAILSAQVDDLTRTLQSAQSAASTSTASLGALTDRAETVARRLELLVASMHDLPEEHDSPAGRAAGDANGIARSKATEGGKPVEPVFRHGDPGGRQ